MNGYNRGDLKRVYWVCGAERRLVEEVVDLIVKRVHANPVNDVRMSAVDVPDRDVWAAMNQYPAAGEERLVLVRDAERIRHWEQLQGWYDTRALRPTKAVFVSNEASTDTEPDHMRLIVGKGRFVRCGPMAEQRHLVEMLKAHAPITDQAAKLLLRVTRGNVSASLDFLSKCALFSGAIDERVIRALATPVPADDFVDAVVEFRGADAMEAARRVDPDRYSAIIGLLESRLEALSKLYRAIRRADRLQDRGARTREILRTSRIEPFIVSQLIGVARRYDQAQVRTCIQALALVDERAAEGESDLILEVLAALWMTKAA
jgi:DNA polymerase III delta subunit